MRAIERRRFAAAFLLTGAAALMFSASLHAQALEPGQWYGVDPARVEPELPYSEGELKLFVRAGLAALRIDSEWRPRIRRAATPVQAGELERQARSEMMRAVEAAGISVETYNRINETAATNPRVRARVKRYRQAFARKAE